MTNATTFVAPGMVLVHFAAGGYCHIPSKYEFVGLHPNALSFFETKFMIEVSDDLVLNESQVNSIDQPGLSLDEHA